LKSYNIEIPKEVPPGTYLFAWAWWNKVGNREMYMNCAPITVTGGGGNDTGYLNTLPGLFMANIDGQCHTTEDDNGVLAIPNPGLNVDVSNNILDKISDIVLGECKSTYNPPDKAPNFPVKGSAGGTIQTPVTYITYSNPPETGATPPTTSAPTGYNSTSAAVSSTLVIVPLSPSVAPSSVDSPAATPYTTVYSTSGAALPSSLSLPANSAVVPPAAPAFGNSGSCPPGRISCPAGANDGVLVCVSSAQFAFCDHGCMQPLSVAAGTVCQNGQIIHAKAVRQSLEVADVDLPSSRTVCHPHAKPSGA
jgi:hypothetical protein